jgi:D-alanyl-lipoteichoic acid acyltransferase DltB (MBOAT superfamily)
MAPSLFVAGFLAYIIIGRLMIWKLAGTLRDVAFAMLNVVGFYYFCMLGQNDHYRVAFVAYLGVVLFQYLMLWLFAERQGSLPWLAFLAPVGVLIAVRYGPLLLAFGGRKPFGGTLQYPLAFYLVGISYLAFRSSHLVLEIRNGAVKRPSLWQYLGFCFFVPTVPVGPINPYSNYRRGFDPVRPSLPVGRAGLRVLVGLAKFLFLGALCNQLGYGSLLRDGHYHRWIDVPVAVIFYYLFLYCNFSGFCDMAIGAAGLMGIPVVENFNNPFAARNVKDFWNRWHITLSLYMRDVVFSPLSKFLVRAFGPGRANHAIAVAIFLVFLLVGIWHGVGWNFAAYGAVHAIGVVTNHYYTIGLKKWLGRDGFKAYNANPWVHALAVVVTFCYCGGSLIFFANTFADLKGILAALR